LWNFTTCLPFPEKANNSSHRGFGTEYAWFHCENEFSPKILPLADQEGGSEHESSQDDGWARYGTGSALGVHARKRPLVLFAVL
jgi:hypothetical protein